MTADAQVPVARAGDSLPRAPSSPSQGPSIPPRNPSSPSPRRPTTARRTQAPARVLRNRTGFRLVFLAPGAVAMVLGLDAALTLLGLPALLGPVLNLDRLAEVHGPLMVLGFVGTVIALERAVALGRAWAYAAPALSGLGALALVAPLPLTVGQGLLVAGQVACLLVYRQLSCASPPTRCPSRSSVWSWRWARPCCGWAASPSPT